MAHTYIKNVKNGQHFCLVKDPTRIYKRICNRVKLDYDDNGYSMSKTVFDIYCLNTKMHHTWFRPTEEKVIILGK